MTAIQGVLETLLDGTGGQLDEQGKHLVQLADRNVDRVISLIDDLLDMYRLEAGLCGLCKQLAGDREQVRDTDQQIRANEPLRLQEVSWRWLLSLNA